MVESVIIFLGFVLRQALLDVILLTIGVAIDDGVVLGLVRVSLNDLIDFIDKCLFCVSEPSLGALLDLLSVLENFRAFFVRLLLYYILGVHIGIRHIF